VPKEITDGTQFRLCQQPTSVRPKKTLKGVIYDTRLVTELSPGLPETSIYKTYTDLKEISDETQSRILQKPTYEQIKLRGVTGEISARRE
jgi:hypothetical protein